MLEFNVSVKEKLAQNTDNEISATSLRISLLCPVSITVCSYAKRPLGAEQQCVAAA